VRRFLANALYLVFGLPLVLSSLALFALRPWALDRTVYKRMVLDDRLYAALQAPEMASLAPDTMELEAAGVGKLSLDGPAIVAAAQKDLPWPEIKSTASSAVDSVMDAVEGKTSGPAAIDLHGLKAALKAKAPELARDYDASLASSGRQDPSNTSRARLSIALASAVDKIPDRAELDEARRPRPSAVGLLSRGPEGLSQALLNRMTATTAAMAALLVAGLGILGGRSFLSRLSRSGAYILIPSVVVLALGVALAIPGGLVLRNLLPDEARAMMAGQGGAQLRAYLASVLGPIAKSVFITGLIGASLGGVLVSTRRFELPKEPEGSIASEDRSPERKER
jgi:hypothetical protein